MAELAVLIRNCAHDSNATDATYIRYALKCDSFSVQIAKTPIQIPVPQQAPEIIDLGFARPSISIGGIVDSIGGDKNYTTIEYFAHMEKISLARYDNAGAVRTNDYFIPYKNKLEDSIYTWTTTESVPLELEIGDAQFPVYNKLVGSATAQNAGTVPNEPQSETGGGVYRVAIQQARFQVDPAQEDRWQFQIQFVCESRLDVYG